MPNAERTTPDNIEKLGPHECFVFGSNNHGRHGKGAALTALRKFGAVYGVGFGPTGRCYAIPTKDGKLNTLPLIDIEHSVMWFKRYAAEKPQLTFLVTAIGTGLAGLCAEDIAPFFRDAPDNVVLPASFLAVLNEKPR